MGLIKRVLTVMVAVAGVGVTGAERPNVLFIAIDDLNDWIGVMGGHPQAVTPHLDRVANRGVLFNNAHCQAPICNPSRVSLISGLLPSTTGVYFMSPRYRDDDSPVKDGQSLFDYFGANGYKTLTRGKIFHANDTSIERFDVNSPARQGGARPKKRLAEGMDDLVRAWDWGPWYESDDEVKDYLTAEWAAEQLKGMRGGGDRPFFMAVGFSLPHVPLYVPQKWFDLYPLDTVYVPNYMDTDMDDISEY
ncbi:MAG: sulfatase-like hydrolase/transferase, partial [Planctomycetota bacterium]